MADQYTVTGMSCAACSARVEKAVSAVPGVDSCVVSLLTNAMAVEGTADAKAVIAAVEKAGYGASLRKSPSGPAGQDNGPNHEAEADNQSEANDLDYLADRETPKLLRRLIASLCFLLPLLYLSMGHVMWGFPLPFALAQNPLAQGIAQLLLCSAILLINRRFFISGSKSLIHLAPNMDALVSLGAAASFLYSVCALFFMTGAAMRSDFSAVHTYLHEFYFESAGMILTLITVGKLLESFAKGRTTDALKSLLRLTPKTATVVRDGREIEIPASRVRTEDIFVVRPGQTIPADGVVLEGSSAVDESTLTGESIPADKEKDSAVSAGTLNQSGFLRCKATRVGEDTTLSQVIQLVNDAAATKAPIARTADKIAGVFVPGVMAIAVITVMIWLLCGQSAGFAIARSVSVLVISCPCALGLATPVAIMVANGKGAKNGILFKTAVSMEETGKVRVAALDKTGTITEGKPRVTDILPAPGVTEKELKRVACALEAKSEHPLARAVTAIAEKSGGSEPAEVQNFTALPGNGLSGVIDGKLCAGGQLSFLETMAPIDAQSKKNADRLADEGKTPLFFCRGKTFLGVIAVADVMKADSRAAVRALQDLGLFVVMLTGDNCRTAKAVGKQAGVDRVMAELKPADKEAAIRELKKQGKVVMVGDGINDAPALTRADIGMAIGAGTDVAIDAADVVLMNSRLSDVPAAIRLSRAALRNIRENLFWAFIYNVIGIPLAAGVYFPRFGVTLNPMFCAAAMSLSSICVVGNALRLNLLKLQKNAEPSPRTTGKENTMEKTLHIEGMMCEHCEARVKEALEALDGVSNAKVSHTDGSAVLSLTADVADSLLKDAVEKAGYQMA